MDEIDKKGKTGHDQGQACVCKSVQTHCTPSLVGSYPTVIDPTVVTLYLMQSPLQDKLSLLAVMSNAFLIIYSPHQHLTSQGELVYSKWAKEEGARQIAFKRS